MKRAVCLNLTNTNQNKMYAIKKLFKEEELTETSSGTFKTICPDCGLQGGRTEGFILFPTNTAYCHSSHKKFNLLETYALKKKIIRCLNGRDSEQKQTILKGELFTQTLDELKEDFSEEDYDAILDSIGLKKTIELPNNGKLISQFANELAQKIKREQIFFYRSDTKKVIEIGKLKHSNGEIFYNGFIDVDSNRFVTLIERYFKPWCKIYTKQGEIVVTKSMPQNIATTVLVSDNFRDEMPVISRIFYVQMPILYNNELTFPKKGYDERFASWLPYNAPVISEPNMELSYAKKLIEDIFQEFCFRTEQDKTNAIAAFITPYLRGLFTSFNTRTPVFIYEANRERAGKDYLAGLTGMLYEGYSLEEPPLSTNDRTQNNSEELRKKILSAMISGRKRLHFSNNKGHLNNAVFESVVTAERWNDRILGRSENLTFDNELDFSLSGNIGMTLTPDLANRSRFIKLFLDIEDANSRIFTNPDLLQWVGEERNLILSALYSLIKNWIDKGSPAGSIPFSSFPQWARICGGIMECAGYMNPCTPDKDTFGITVDSETANMKTLFELCYEHKPDTWLKKSDIVELIKQEGEELFGFYDWDKKSDQIRFAIQFSKYVGRILSDIKLVIRNSTTRAVRQEFRFVKENKNGNLGMVGNISNRLYLIYNRSYNCLQTLPTSPTLPQKPQKSDRETQFWEAKECENIKPNFSKQEVLDWIKANPNYDYKTLYDKFGVGCLKFRNELKKEGLT